MLKGNFFKLLTSILLLSLSNTVYSISISYLRTLQCIDSTNSTCLRWNQTVSLSLKAMYYFCFPQNTYVETKRGPRTMAQLKVGDLVLGINPKNEQIGYSRVQFWLYKNQIGTAEFQSLKLQNGTSFQASSYHNLGYFDKDGKISYKFVNQFKEGDYLVGFPHQAVKVAMRVSGIQRKGLYSPYTSFKNYFVYEAGFQKESKKGTMILAHVLSQLENPSRKDSLTDILMWSTNLFVNSQEAQGRLMYTHPSISDWSFLYGSSWKTVHNQMTFDYEMIIRASIRSQMKQQRRRINAMLGVTAILLLCNLSFSN